MKIENHLFTGSLCVCDSGCETGDVGGGTEEADEPSQQHRGEDRQVGSLLSSLNLTFFFFSHVIEIVIKNPHGFHWTLSILSHRFEMIPEFTVQFKSKFFMFWVL